LSSSVSEDGKEIYLFDHRALANMEKKGLPQEQPSSTIELLFRKSERQEEIYLFDYINL